MKKLKKLFLVIFLLYKTYNIMAQDGSPGISPSIKTFALNPDKVGSAISSVNLFTGDVLFPISLISLPGRNGLNANVSISYNSNVQNIVGRWNLEAPTGILGLGWSMDFSRIVCDHKQTGAREDDTFYIIEGGNSNELVCTNISGSGNGAYRLYETRNYKFWKIKYFTTIERWEIIKEDGSTYVYGDINSGRKTIQWGVRWGNWIGASILTQGQCQFASAWNLSEVINQWGDKITNEYFNQESRVGPNGQYQTEASYLKKITDMFGRKVEFVYLDKSTFIFNGKSSQFYMQPHDATGEESLNPDAYQEFYEKYYLDKIVVSNEEGNNIFNIKFGYTAIDEGTNMAKMLLSSIIQMNPNGNVLPGIKFSYYLFENKIKGFLNQVTSPTGGVVTYNYNLDGLSLIHSKKDFEAMAPDGYNEPFIFMEENYVVFAWRKLKDDGTSDAGPKDVVVRIYEWVGEWREYNVGTIGTVELNYPYIRFEESSESFRRYGYKDFQASLQKNFFALLKKDAFGWYLWIVYKDETSKGKWTTISPDYYPGSDSPTLVTGENYVFMGSKSATVSNSNLVYTFQRNSWKREVIKSPCGEHYYTGTNNYFIDQNKYICNNTPNGPCVYPEFRFSYLDENKTWKHILQCLPKLSSFDYDGISFQPSNSFAVSLIANNPGYIYLWDSNYNITRNNNDLGTWSADSYINIFNNSLIGITSRQGFGAGRTLRFNGVNWSYDTDIIPYYKDYIAYSDENILWQKDASFGPGFLRSYSPNTNTWNNIELSLYTPKPIYSGHKPNSIGSNIALFNDKIFIKGTNDLWLAKFNILDLPGVNDWLTGFDPTIYWGKEFKVGTNYFYYGKIHFMKNGTLGKYYDLPFSFWQRSNGEYYQTINSNTIVTNSSKSLKLNRLLYEEMYGNQLDYPVTSILEYDGSTLHILYIDYDANTAVSDISGSIAQYNKVTVAQTNDINPPVKNTNKIGYVSYSIPEGYTEYFFYNGVEAKYLDNKDIYISSSDKLIGLTYLNKFFDSKNNQVLLNRTDYTIFSQAIKNNLGNQVDVGYYVRPRLSTTIKDGIKSLTSTDYNEIGMVKSTGILNYNSKDVNEPGTGTSVNLDILYTYFWEQYDKSKSLNILSPVIQIKKVLYGGNPVVNPIESSATTWKTWGTSNIWAPHKSYIWKRTGSSDFDFTNWSNLGEPSSDWIKVSEINSIDSKGNILQTTTR